MFPFDPKHDYLVGIDSDGCAFDTMELKHKECFIPNTINYYELQGVSKYAREAAEFVNLYSKSRGINRFPALIETLEWLQKRPEVKARGIADPDSPGAGGLDAARDEARQSGAGEGRGGDGRPGPEAGAGLVRRRSTRRSRGWSAGCRRFRSCARASSSSAGRPTSWSSPRRRKRPS